MYVRAPPRTRLENHNSQMGGQERGEEAELVVVNDDPGEAAQATDGPEIGAPEVKVLQPGAREVKGADGAVLQRHPCVGGGAEVQLVEDAEAD